MKLPVLRGDGPLFFLTAVLCLMALLFVAQAMLPGSCCQLRWRQGMVAPLYTKHHRKLESFLICPVTCCCVSICCTVQRGWLVCLNTCLRAATARTQAYDYCALNTSHGRKATDIFLGKQYSYSFPYLKRLPFRKQISHHVKLKESNSVKIHQQKKILVLNQEKKIEQFGNGMYLSMHKDTEFYFVPLIVLIIG